VWDLGVWVSDILWGKSLYIIHGKEEGGGQRGTRRLRGSIVRLRPWRCLRLARCSQKARWRVGMGESSEPFLESRFNSQSVTSYGWAASRTTRRRMHK